MGGEAVLYFLADSNYNAAARMLGGWRCLRRGGSERAAARHGLQIRCLSGARAVRSIQHSCVLRWMDNGCV